VIVSCHFSEPSTVEGLGFFISNLYKGTKNGAIPSGNCDVITKTKGIVLKFKIKRQNKTSLSEKKWNTNMENQELPAQAEDEEAAQSASEEMVIQEPGEPRPEQSHLNTFR